VFHASYAMRPVFPSAFHELRCEIRSDRVKLHEAQLSRKEWKAIMPPNAADGRDVLLAIIDKAIERLRRLEAAQVEVAEILEMVEPNIVSDAEAKSVAQIQRHAESANHLVLRNLDTIKRWHRWEAEGWRKIRRERAQQKEEAGRTRPYDPRMVVDDQRKIRGAEGYKGNLEEGLMRYEAEVGKQLWDFNGKPRHCDEESSRGAVPDYACCAAGEHRRAADWSSGVERPGGGTDTAGKMNEDAVAEAEIQEGATDFRQVGPSDSVPLTLTGQEPATNIQNGIRSDEAGEAVGDGRRTGPAPTGIMGVAQSAVSEEARCPGLHGCSSAALGEDRSSDSVPLTLTGQEPATNVQNGIGGGGTGDAVDDAVIEDLEAGQDEGGETDGREEGGGDDFTASLPDKGCVEPRRVAEPLSKRERRWRRWKMAMKEHQRRRGVVHTERNVPLGELLDSVKWLMPKSVALIRKYGPRSP
jgi:hypothetical protein